MRVSRLHSVGDLVEADRIIATAFLHEWDAREARDRRASGEGGEELWAAFDDAGRMVAAVSTLRHELFFEGTAVPVGELHMVGSLPEARGGGAVRHLVEEVLRAFARRGDLFCALIPFSCAFYRKFGFELASAHLRQRVATSQLAGLPCDLSVRQLSSVDDVYGMRELRERFAVRYNMARRRDDDAWRWREGAEVGERSFGHEGQTHYTYLFSDEAGGLRAYLTFVFVEGPRGPFTGEMDVVDYAFDGPLALRAMLGFAFGMRAKVTHLNITLPQTLDLATMVPEGTEVERTMEGHHMFRVLDVATVLSRLPAPEGARTWSVQVTDDFLPELGGTFRVAYRDGACGGVEATRDPADLCLTTQTLACLAIGHMDLEAATYRPGTEVRARRDVLQGVFTRRATLCDL